MNHAILEKSTLFKGIPAKELRSILETIPHHIQCYDKGETILHLMEKADKIGILLEGRVQAQKPFPNGNQVNVSVRVPGEMLGHAAAFARSHTYPCDIVALEPSTIMMFRREDVLLLMQRDLRILENFTTEIASATYMLQQRLELLSYSGIAQKAAFYLLLQARQTQKDTIRIPESVSNWALIMNVSRSSLHRELTKLATNGVISYAPPFIHIMNESALESVLAE